MASNANVLILPLKRRQPQVYVVPFLGETGNTFFLVGNIN